MSHQVPSIMPAISIFPVGGGIGGMGPRWVTLEMLSVSLSGDFGRLPEVKKKHLRSTHPTNSFQGGCQLHPKSDAELIPLLIPKGCQMSQEKNPYYFPLYLLVNRDSYNGTL